MIFLHPHVLAFARPFLEVMFGFSPGQIFQVHEPSDLLTVFFLLRSFFGLLKVPDWLEDQTGSGCYRSFCLTKNS